MKWTRTRALSPSSSLETETWTAWDGARSIASFEVEVTRGKPLDILSLKGTSLEEIREYAEYLQQTAEELYAEGGPRRRVCRCPCCDAPTEDAAEEIAPFGIPYHRCAQCDHLFVREQPATEVLNKVFAEAQEHSAVYTDSDSLEVRLEQIIRPKVEWTLDAFRKFVGGKITRAVDVGAGGGHFVEGMRRAGIQTDGYELSNSSRQFALEAFGIELKDEDFIEPGSADDSSDIVTFWGLLEYVPDPRAFLRAARERLNSGKGLLVVEIPRHFCLGSDAQKQSPWTIARHLDPTSHVNCFSDSSLATALYSSGFRPVAAWYFGMDVYELFVQQALRIREPRLLQELAEWIPDLQYLLDRAGACDDLVVAAVPIPPLENPSNG